MYMHCDVSDKSRNSLQAYEKLKTNLPPNIVIKAEYDIREFYVTMNTYVPKIDKPDMYIEGRKVLDINYTNLLYERIDLATGDVNYLYVTETTYRLQTNPDYTIVLETPIAPSVFNELYQVHNIKTWTSYKKLMMFDKMNNIDLYARYNTITNSFSICYHYKTLKQWTEIGNQIAGFDKQRFPLNTTPKPVYDDPAAAAYIESHQKYYRYGDPEEAKKNSMKKQAEIRANKVAEAKLKENPKQVNKQNMDAAIYDQKYYPTESASSAPASPPVVTSSVTNQTGQRGLYTIGSMTLKPVSKKKNRDEDDADND